MHELLTVEQMAMADRLTIEAGTPGIDLMERAGGAVAALASDRCRREPKCRGAIHVLCGPGNNGGDGYVAARILTAAGYKVLAWSAQDGDALRGDARLAYERWGGKCGDLDGFGPECGDLIVDALFGAGLDRPLTGLHAEVIERANRSAAPILSVDLPSGIHGDTGAMLGAAMRADATVTFFRKKPAHLLYPGRAHCGEVTVAQIGIRDTVMASLSPQWCENGPPIWRGLGGLHKATRHKYDRGHALVVSGPASRTGAARLAAQAALRAGCGLATIASPADAVAINAAHLTEIMLRSMQGPAALASILEDRRFTSVALGPALGVDETTCRLTETALESGRSCVLDADALTSFARQTERLCAALRHSELPAVLTPHRGEFERLFPAGDSRRSKPQATLGAARASGATIVYKGADTVIASPDGRVSINANAPAWLATAGSGDVLTGIIAGMLARGVPAHEAACAGVWLHGEAGRLAGNGLIAGEIAGWLPEPLRLAQLA